MANAAGTGKSQRSESATAALPHSINTQQAALVDNSNTVLSILVLSAFNMVVLFGGVDSLSPG